MLLSAKEVFKNAMPFSCSDTVRNIIQGGRINVMKGSNRGKSARQAKVRMRKPVKEPKKRARKALATRPQKQPKVAGTVLKIVQGQLTNERISAEAAFSDPEQAVEQMLYAERHATREKLKVVRLAYRQYQGKRFRAK